VKRAALYARYSTDLQNEKSVEDQFALCQAYAAREGLVVVETFADRAQSGASMIERDGLLALMAQVPLGRFDVVVVEAADRLSRDMADLAGVHKRLTFHAIESGRCIAAWSIRPWSGCTGSSAKCSGRKGSRKFGAGSLVSCGTAGFRARSLTAIGCSPNSTRAAIRFAGSGKLTKHRPKSSGASSPSTRMATRLVTLPAA
jgi:hypothetical protein